MANWWLGAWFGALERMDPNHPPKPPISHALIDVDRKKKYKESTSKMGKIVWVGPLSSTFSVQKSLDLGDSSP